jgi:hypothetical protein
MASNKVELACEKTLEAEAINVNLIGRMIERATEVDKLDEVPLPHVIQGRFWRDPSEFSATKQVNQ